MSLESQPEGVQAGTSMADKPSLNAGTGYTASGREKSPLDSIADVELLSLEELRDQILYALDHVRWKVEKRVADLRPFGVSYPRWLKSEYELRTIFEQYERHARAKAKEERANRILASRTVKGEVSKRERRLAGENAKLQAKNIQLSSDLYKMRSRFAHLDSEFDDSDMNESESDERPDTDSDGDTQAPGASKKISKPGKSSKDRVKRWKALETRRGRTMVVSDDTPLDKLLKRKSDSKNAIELFRNWDENGVPKSSTIKVWSKPLIKLLESVIDYYPGNEVQYPPDGTITMKEPFFVLFAFRRKIEAALAKVDGAAADHGKLLMNLVMNEEMQSQALKHAEIEARLCNDITFREIWLLYTPGSVVYSKYQGHWRAYRVEQTEGYAVNDNNDVLEGVFHVNCSFASLDKKGSKIQRRVTSFKLLPFTGSDSIKNLSYIPAAFMENEAELRNQLVERGKAYWSYRSTSHHRVYKGDAWPSFEHEQSMRVIIDYSTTSKATLDDQLSDDDRTGNDRLKPISTEFGDKKDESFLFCPSHVHAFSLQEKSWREVALDELYPVEFNENAFKKIVLDKTYKQTVAAMATSHLQKIATTQDLIVGKGKSLVILLHGSPGTGKTLTAEYSKRPLYMVTSGDLGTDVTDLELKLRRTFEYAANWNAVLLLDEADVFLQERDVTYLDRNALVSVFLRELEYFQGLIFLTTNRPGALDEAFQSRIHITLSLPDLNRDARIKIWALFVKELPLEMRAKQQLLGEIEAHVGKVALNGRQIRNFMQAARALAQQEGVDIGIKHVKDVVHIGQKFTAYMKKVNRMDLEQKAEALGLRLKESIAE